MKKILVIIIAALVASSAHAAPYVDLMLGGSSQYLRHQNSSSDSETHPMLGLRVGYRLIDNFAVETAWLGYRGPESEWQDNDETVTQIILISSLQIGGVGTLPLTSRLALNARAGIAFWTFRTDYEYKEPDYQTETETYREMGRSPYYGLGIDYRIGDNVRVGLNSSILTMNLKLEEANANYRYHTNSGFLLLGWRF